MPKYKPPVRSRTFSGPVPRMLAQPWVPEALPLRDDDEGYKIPRLVQLLPLAVEVQELWTGGDILDPGEITSLTWYWDGVQVGDIKELVAPYDESDLPDVASEIPPILMAVPGLHSLQYVVELVFGNPSEPSFPILVDIDKVAPNQGQQWNRMIFPPEIVDFGVTDEYLADPVNGDRVIAVLEPWPDMRLEDIATGYLTLLPAVRSPHTRYRRTDAVAQVAITQAHKDGAPIELVFEGDYLRTLQSGREYSAQFRLTDRAGWEGPPSRTAILLIALTPTPVEFRAPEVPQAFGTGSNGRIDLEDARAPNGVFMNIVEIFGAEPGDVLRPSWNLIPLPEIIVGDFQVWPIRVAISWPILAQGGFELVGGIVRASYTWQRGTSVIRPSVVRFVPVDLTAAGELNPNNPDFTNPVLLLPTVKGKTGDDVLTIADTNQPADVELLLGIGFEAGDELQLFWNEAPVPGAVYTVGPLDAPGRLIPFQIPWLLIQPIGNAVVNLYYETFNGVNSQRSRNKPVTLAINPIIGLRPTTYEDVNYGPGPDSGFIGCTTNPHPSHGVLVKVPGDDTRLEVGDVLRLRWAGYASTNGNASALIGDSVGEFDSPPLTQEWVENGYPFIVPFDPYVLLPGLVKPDDYPSKPRWGSVTTSYTVLRNGVNIGSSNRSLVSVTLIRPNGLPPCIADA